MGKQEAGLFFFNTFRLELWKASRCLAGVGFLGCGRALGFLGFGGVGLAGLAVLGARSFAAERCTVSGEWFAVCVSVGLRVNRAIGHG